VNIKSKHPIELLPWYVNDTLSGQEKQDIESHLESCETCQQEIELLKLIRTETKKTDANAAPGELAKMRFMREIKAEKATSKQTANKRPWWQPASAIAAALVIVIQTGVILNNPNATNGNGVELLGKSLGEFSVQFNKDANSNAISKFLLEINARITNGPIESSDGQIFYELDLEAINENSSNENLKQWATKIKSYDKIVKDINPIDTGE